MHIDLNKKNVLKLLRAFFLVVTLVVPLLSSAQLKDSIIATLKAKPKFSFRFDSHTSFISNQPAKTSGVKIGLDWDKTIRAGVGFHWLNTAFERSRTLAHQEGVDTVNTTLDLRYFSYYAEYVFYRHNKWEFGIPQLIGFGGLSDKWVNDNGREILLDERIVVLYESTITGQYKIFNWFGIGAGAGYRLMLLNNKVLKEKLSSPLYLFKLKLFIGDLYKGLVGKGDE